jgi:hypothetical protein
MYGICDVTVDLRYPKRLGSRIEEDVHRTGGVVSTTDDGIEREHWHQQQHQTLRIITFNNLYECYVLLGD